jgi:hypothetical protein
LAEDKQIPRKSTELTVQDNVVLSRCNPIPTCDNNIAMLTDVIPLLSDENNKCVNAPQNNNDNNDNGPATEIKDAPNCHAIFCKECGKEIYLNTVIVSASSGGGNVNDSKLDRIHCNAVYSSSLFTTD